MFEVPSSRKLDYYPHLQLFAHLLDHMIDF